MADIVLFHHAQGLTPGVFALADQLAAAGHRVSTPDLYEGQTFDALEDGIAHAQRVGFQVLEDRGVAAAAEAPEGAVFAGMSMGVMPAQRLAQTRPGCGGALLLHGAVPLGFFGDRWPDGVPLQIHTMADDEYGDVVEARELAAAAEGAELFVYPGSAHLFTDISLAAYEPQAAALVMQRVLAFLGRIDADAS